MSYLYQYSGTYQHSSLGTAVVDGTVVLTRKITTPGHYQHLRKLIVDQEDVDLTDPKKLSIVSITLLHEEEEEVRCEFCNEKPLTDEERKHIEEYGDVVPEKEAP